MATRFYWVGQTLNTNQKLDAFNWNNKLNWRQEVTAGRQADKAIYRIQLSPTRVPGQIATGSIDGRDEVYFGSTLLDPDGKYRITVKSPCLFGGVTGSIAPDSPTQGMTWESGAFTGGVDIYIENGATFSQEYPFPVIGGGITGGGQSYWNNYGEFVAWAASYYNLTTGDQATIFSTPNLWKNLNQLKVKAVKIVETAIPTSPLLVSMQIAKTFLAGSTFACTEYIRQGQNIKTYIQNSVLSKISNTASRKAQTDPRTGRIGLPVNVNNQLTVSYSVAHRYEGYYDDNVNIKGNCKLTSAEIFSPAIPTDVPDSIGYANELLNIKLAGRYGIYYTSQYIGLTGIAADGSDGTIKLGDTKQPFIGQRYYPQYKVSIGESKLVAGSTASYIKRLESLNNNVMFVGNTQVAYMLADNTYIGYYSELASGSDTVNITTLDLKNQSSLDLTITPGFDRWYFGNLPAGETLVQGGIYAFGDGNKLYGSPGVALFNDVLMSTQDIKVGRGSTPKPDTNRNRPDITTTPPVVNIVN